MKIHDNIRNGICPNGCGKLILFKFPIYIWELCPVEVLEAYYDSQADDNVDFDHVAIGAVCPMCSFVVTGTAKDRPHPNGHISSIHYGDEQNVEPDQ